MTQYSSSNIWTDPLQIIYFTRITYRMKNLNIEMYALI